jgi:hypothetical protein
VANEQPAATCRKCDDRIPRSDFDRLRIEYVGGHRPYLWIADADGKFIDAIDVKALREFLKGQRRWA